MGYKCGNTGKEFQTRAEWIKHLVKEMRSPILEGDAKDVELCKKELTKMKNDPDTQEWATKTLERYE